MTTKDHPDPQRPRAWGECEVGENCDFGTCYHPLLLAQVMNLIPDRAPQPSGVEKDVLLPCPFCGAEPLTERSKYAGDDDYGEVYVYCPGINCPGHGGGTLDAWETRPVSGRTVTVPVEVLRELADLRAEYARMRRVAQQIADGSGCANCRGIAIEFDTTVGSGE